MSKPISRREFLRFAGLASFSSVLAACAPQVIEKTVEVKQTVEVPVEKTVQVKQTVEVPVEKVVEKTVEVPVMTERKKVTLLHFFGRADDPRRAMMDKMTGDFNLTSQSNAVEAIYVPFGNIDTKMQAGIAAGDPNDVWVGTGQDGCTYGYQKGALDLDPYFAISSLPKCTPDNWVGYAIEVWQNLGLDGHIYGVPFLPDTRFLFMDAAAFKEVGLDPAKPPETADDLWAYADKLDKGSKSKWERIGFNPIAGNTYFMNWSFAMGLNMWDKLDAKGIPQLDRPEVRELIDWFIKWRDRYGKVELDAFTTLYTGTTDAYLSGTNPIQINGSWMPLSYKTAAPDFQQAWALHPKYGSKGVHASWGAGAGMLIAANSKNPDGAWKLVEFINQKERLTEYCITTGTFVGRLDAMSDPNLAAKIGPHWPIAVKQLTLTSSSQSAYGGWPSLCAHLAMDSVWQGTKKTVDEALQEQQDLLKQAIDDFLAKNPDVEYKPQGLFQRPA
jgi:multiple sugar transport system substrate-binding protein